MFLATAIDAHQSEGEVPDSEEHSSCSPPDSKKEESARNMALLLQRESASSLASVVTPTLYVQCMCGTVVRYPDTVECMQSL